MTRAHEEDSVLVVVARWRVAKQGFGAWGGSPVANQAFRPRGNLGCCEDKVTNNQVISCAPSTWQLVLR